MMLFFGLLFSLFTTSGAEAAPGTATFQIQSDTKYIVRVALFSAKRNKSWPSSGEYWEIVDSKPKTYKVACEVGEKICYGAWYQHLSAEWGVGHKNRYECKDCCITCGTVEENVHMQKVTLAD
jgi:hypothetical protein